MGYARKFRISPDARGYQLDIWFTPVAGEPYWSGIMNYKTKEETEAAVKRLSSKEEWFFDENGEAV
jgi:hypothetical protein